MEELLHCHNHTLIIIFLISSLILYVISLYINDQPNLYKNNRYARSGDNLSYPIVIILIIIALSSLQILYIVDEINNPSLIIKTIGHH